MGEEVKCDFDSKNQATDHYTVTKRTRSVWKNNLHCFISL